MYFAERSFAWLVHRRGFWSVGKYTGRAQRSADSGNGGNHRSHNDAKQTNSRAGVADTTSRNAPTDCGYCEEKSQKQLPSGGGDA